MQAHRVETILGEDGQLTLDSLPFKKGTRVEVIVLDTASTPRTDYPLRGQPMHFDRPCDPVASDEWDLER